MSTPNILFTEVNSDTAVDSAYDLTKEIADNFRSISGAVKTLEDVRDFINFGLAQKYIPTVVERLCRKYNEAVESSSAEVSEQLSDDVAGEGTLSAEALAYLANNSHANKINNFNNVILNKDYSLKKIGNVGDAEKIDELRELHDHAVNILNDITGFLNDDYDDYDDEEYEECDCYADYTDECECDVLCDCREEHEEYDEEDWQSIDLSFDDPEDDD